MAARLNLIGDAWNNTAKTTIQTGTPITDDPKLTQLTELMSAFSNGEINFSTLKARLASLDITVNGATTRASFTYRGKTYNVQQKTGAYYKNTTFSSSTLRDIYKLTDEQINTYFTKKSETEYEINKSSGCKTIVAVLAKVAVQYQNDMLLANFLNDKNKTTNRSTELKKTSDNKTISSYNYQDYIDEIQSTLGTDTEAAKKKALDKFITDFTQGNIAYSTVSSILKAIGVEYKLSNKGSDVGIQFTFDNKTYQLSCKLKAAIRGTDDNTVKTYSADSLTRTGATQTLINKYFDSVTTVDGTAQTYALKNYVTYTQFLAEVEKEKTPATFSYSELKNTYKFTDDIINKYFKEEGTANAKPDTGAAASKVYISNTGAAASKVYILNTETGCKTIDDVEQKMAEQYQKAIILVNFLNDKNKQTDNEDDMKKAGDGNTITKDNYQNYADEIKKALGNDEDAIVEKALEKLVKDFTEGNISMLMVGLITKSIGGSNSHFALKGLELGFGFEYDGKTYQMYTNASAVGSGVDTNSVKTYTAEELQKTGATQDQINNYFASSLEIDGVTKSYHLRSARTYAQFEEEVKASQKKNGVETSTNAQGCKIETTYVDGVVTKVVEYKKDSKYVTSETEYYANGQVKHNINYDRGDKKSETEYYENGKIKSATTYDYYGPTTENYDTNGKLQTRTEYDYNGKQVTTYNSDGSNVKTTYDKETNKPIKEIRTSANGTVRYFTIKLADDGSKTLTEYKSNPSGFLDSDKIGVEKYDAQGRFTYKSKYQNAYSYTDTEYIYNEDGSRREVSYDAHNDNARGNITSDKTYDKNGRLIKSASYPRNNYTLPTTEVLYSYDSNGAISTKTTIEYDVNNGKQRKKSETVTDKNGKVLSKVTYESGYQDKNTGKYVDKERKIVTTNDGDKSTVTTYIANQITQEVVTNNAKNTKTTTTYKNGKKSHEVITQNNKTISEESYDKNGALQTTTKYVYSSDGNYVISVYDKNEKLLKYIEIVTKDGKTTETTKTATGATTSEKVTTKDSNGRAKTETKNYDANGKLTSRMVTWYSSNGKDYYEDTYDSRGLITKRVVNNVAYNYTYSNYVDSKNYTQTRKCSKGGTLVSTKENGVVTKTVETKTNGDIETIIYDPKTGKKKVSYYKTKSTGAIKTTEYNANGKALGSFKSRMKDGNVVYYLDPKTKTGLSASMDIKCLYDRITDSINTKDAIAALKKMGGDITYEFLKMAQPGYNGKPSGSDKTYVGYKNAPSNAQAHIKKDLAGTVPEYGYTPEEVKGYHYSTTSAMSKKISTNQNFTDYVKNNIKNLINGTNLSSTRLDFEQDVDKDLWGSLHGTDVVATKLEGTKLTITIYDLYNFENLQGDSNTDVLNRAGYSAMKDGKLKPYYVLIDVVIDLSKSPYNMTQAQINQIAGK